MYYVEWLRVRNCLRVLGIIFAIGFGLAILVRLFMPTTLNGGESHYMNVLDQHGVRTTSVRLGNGETRTTVVDSEGDRMVIVDRGWHGKHVTVSGPNVSVQGQGNVTVGPIGVHSYDTASGGEVVVATDEPIDIRFLLVGPMIVGFIIATILGGVLAKENRNHLEIAWTKPVSREVMALGLFGVDAIAITGAIFGAFILELAGIAMYEMPRISADATAIVTAFLMLFGVLAFYALCNAATSSLRGGGGMKALVWLAVLFVPSISMAALVPVLIFVIIGNVFGGLALLDPLAYLSMSCNNGQCGSGVPQGVFGAAVFVAPPLERLVLVLVLVALYAAASLLQWRRLEA